MCPHIPVKKLHFSLQLDQHLKVKNIYGSKLRLKNLFLLEEERDEKNTTTKNLVVALVVINQQCGVTNTNNLRLR